MPFVHIIRHGESENNALWNRLMERNGGAKAVHANPKLYAQVYKDDMAERSNDPKITERGVKQAALMGKRVLAKILGADCNNIGAPSKVPVTLVTSPMLRCCMTTEPLYAALASRPDAIDLKLICNGRLFETGGCYHGGKAFPGRTFKQIEADHATMNFDGATMYAEGKGWYEYAQERETPAMKRERVEMLYTWLLRTMSSSQSPSSVYILVCHGHIMSMLMHRMMGMLPSLSSSCFVTTNTGISTLQFIAARGGFLLHTMNDFSHLAHDSALISGNHAEKDSWQSMVPRVRLDAIEIVRYDNWNAVPERTRDILAVMRRDVLGFRSRRDGQG